MAKKTTNNRRNRSALQEKKSDFKIIPLGGLKEIGKNCTLIQYEDNILMIDCGFCFPDDEMFGIDVVIPDFAYIRQNIEKVRGLVITHGHEDHIGGVPFLLKEFNIPVYATPLAMGLIDNKLEEHSLYAEKHVINAGDVFEVGCFTVEAIRVNHSIADSTAYSIRFPGGHVLHTGDFKVDYSPLDGKTIDINRLSRLGDEGVDVLLADSTNVLREGYTPSEAIVGEAINRIFEKTNKRIIIATFSSNIYRIRCFMEAAMKNGRRIAVSGRSMEKVITLARELGYLNTIPESLFVDMTNVKQIPDNNIVILTTGSQGEAMSALTRMANDNHKAVKLKKGDVVVFSSSPIPGNEKTVTNVVNKLYEKGVEVVLSDSIDVHVSGHACKEELKLIHTLVRPKYFIPAHGEYRHLIEHGRLAAGLGCPKNNIFVMSNGDALFVTEKNAHIEAGYTSGADIMVDGLGIGDVGSTVLKDRKQLSQSGLIVIGVSIDTATGVLQSEPVIETKGFIYVKNNTDLINEAKSVVYNTIATAFDKNAMDNASLSKALKDDMKTYIYKRTGRSPVILPVIMYI